MTRTPPFANPRGDKPRPPDAPHCFAVASQHGSRCCFGTCGEPAEFHVYWGPSGCGHLCKGCARKVERSAKRDRRHVEIVPLKGQAQLPFGRGVRA